MHYLAQDLAAQTKQTLYSGPNLHTAPQSHRHYSIV